MCRLVIARGEPVADNSPTAQAVLLGGQLRAFREAAGKTQADVARHVGCPISTINTIENAKRHAPEPHLKLMLQFYGVDNKRAEELVHLAKQARKPGWWADYGDSVPHWFTRYVGLEAAARVNKTYEAEHVPGLLQTRRYIEALVAAMHTVGPSDRAESLAAVRATRQRRLVDGEQPLTLTAVINQAVILREVGGPDVMREQLVYLREMADLPNVTLLILPFSAGAHPAMTGPFTMLQFSEALINAVFLEFPDGAVYVDRPKDVQRYEATFATLIDLALSEADTKKMIERSERDY